jgi:hypothetical protein
VTAGTWFFHVRAADVPGNWGRTAHYELRVSPPQPGTLEFGVPEGKEKVRWPDPLLVRARGCATVIPESLKVTVAGRRFTTADAALQFDQPSGAVSFFPDLVEPDAWIFPAGHRVKMVIDDAAGLDGSALPKPVSFEFTSQSPLALEFPESAGTTNQLPSFTSPIPHAVLPAAWFSSAPRVRLADPPDGSGFRWLPQVEAERDAPGIQSLQLQLPVSWFSEKARLRNPDKDFLPCAWSFGLVPNGTQEDAAVWTPGGLLASYYGPPEKAAETGGATTGPLLARRVDRFVYCVPDDASAMPAVPQATSARWEGMLYVPSTDEWSFEFLLRTTQVKAEMILDGKTVLTTKDQWHPHVVSGRRFLTRGFHAVQIDMTSPRTGWYLEWFWEAEDWYALRRVPPENLFARVPLRAASGKQ